MEFSNSQMFSVNRAIARQRLMAEMASQEEGERRSARRQSETSLHSPTLQIKDQNLIYLHEQRMRLRRSRSERGGRSSPGPPPTIQDSNGYLLPVTPMVNLLTSPKLMRAAKISENEGKGRRKTGSPARKDSQLRLRLTDHERKALKITWKKMRSASTTSGMGVISTMQRAFDKLVEKKPKVKDFFFKAAFVNAMGNGRFQQTDSITTIRDHSKMLVSLFDDIMAKLDERNLIDNPGHIGECHMGLKPIGFNSDVWEVFGETLADVMFMQDCVRAYPYASKAWIILIAAVTDSMRVSFEQANRRRSISSQHSDSLDEGSSQCSAKLSLEIPRNRRLVQQKSEEIPREKSACEKKTSLEFREKSDDNVSYDRNYTHDELW